MATVDELEMRLAELEARLGPVPLAVPPIQIGELTDVPAPGSAIASQWAQEVSGRIMHRFASVAARNTAIPAPVAGMQCYTLAEDTFWQYGAGAWLVRYAPFGLGEVAYVAQPTPIGPFGPGVSDLGGLAVTFTSVPGGRYEILGSVELSTNSASNAVISLSITDAANGIVNIRRHTIIAGSYGHFTVFGRVTPGGGANTYKLRAEANTGTINANDASNVGIMRVHRVA